MLKAAYAGSRKYGKCWEYDMSRDLTAADLAGLFAEIAVAIERERDRLCALDGVIGDGDHGVTMSIGFGAVADALRALDITAVDPTAVFNCVAKAFLNAVGASAGPLYATAFMRAGAAVKGKATLDDDAVVATVVAMAKGVQDRGKAERGEKTMIDAWLPAADAALAARGEGKDMTSCLAAAAKAAADGAEATKAMLATKGRSARLGERVIGHIDAGAASTALILATLAAGVASLQRAEPLALKV
jgi:phosphoenolpyruvate---glycerone phosphotransferase subunit DhaL